MIQPPFHDGKLHVQEKQCSTCIFRPGNLMSLDPGRVAGMVREARANESSITCHDTLFGLSDQESVCRGFFDRHPTRPLRFAVALHVIEWT